MKNSHSGTKTQFYLMEFLVALDFSSASMENIIVCPRLPFAHRYVIVLWLLRMKYHFDSDKHITVHQAELLLGTTKGTKRRDNYLKSML